MVRVGVGAAVIRQARRVRRRAPRAPRARPLGAPGALEAQEALLDQQEEPNLGVAVALVAPVAPVALVEPQAALLQSVLHMAVAGITRAVLHQHTVLGGDHPAVSCPSHWPEQRSESSLVSGSIQSMPIPTIMITASIIVPTLRSPKGRTRLSLSLVCASSTAPADVTTTRIRLIWIRWWEMGALRIKIAH